jgi:hypothetical protein
MKQCPNPDCLSYQQHRKFYDDDTICPRCGDVLVSTNAPAGAPVVVDPYPAYAARPPAPPISSALAMLGAVGTLLLVFLLIGLLLQLGMVHGRTPVGAPGSGTLPVPTTVIFTPIAFTGAQATETARAIATAAAQPTPIGGLIGVTPTLPPLPGAVGGGGTGGATNPGGPSGGITNLTPITSINGVTAGLCRRIDAGALCDPVSVYGPNDTFYISVQATFGDGAARTIRVRLYGPPNGETPLLNQDQTNTPGRTGRFYVGFAFSQSVPWAPGIYRANVFVNNDTVRSTYITWTVQ